MIETLYNSSVSISVSTCVYLYMYIYIILIYIYIYSITSNSLTYASIYLFIEFSMCVLYLCFYLCHFLPNAPANCHSSAPMCLGDLIEPSLLLATEPYICHGIMASRLGGSAARRLSQGHGSRFHLSHPTHSFWRVSSRFHGRAQKEAGGRT